MNIEGQNNHLNSSNKKKNISAKVNETVEMSTDEVKALLDFGNGKISFHELLNVSENGFRSCILNYIKTHPPLTQGQEGEIYKIQGKNKEYIVAKKRFDMKSKHESHMQKLFYDFAQSTDTQVSVPELVHEFRDDSNGYIVMEWVNGQTLYTMSWTEIVNQHLIPELLNRGEYDAYKLDLDIFLQNFEQDNKIVFKDDSQAGEGIKDLLTIMYHQGLVENPQTIQTEESGVKTYPVIKEIYEKYIGEINIFSKEQGNLLKQELRTFFAQAHKQGLYHRDIGGNPRNIMFEQTSTGEYKPWIIDFGMSIESGSGENPNLDDMTGGVYDPDESVIERINSLSGEHNIDYSLRNQLNTNREITKKGKKHELEITGVDIKNAIGTLGYLDIQKVFSDFTTGKDKSYNWFIYFKKNLSHLEQTSTQRGIKKLFIMIQLMNQQQRKELEAVIKQGLNQRKNSKQYKLASLMNTYM